MILEQTPIIIRKRQAKMIKHKRNRPSGRFLFYCSIVYSFCETFQYKTRLVIFPFALAK